MKRGKIDLIVVLLLVACSRNDVSPDDFTSYKDTAMTQMFRQTSGVLAADGAHSIALNGGKPLALWRQLH